MRLLKIGTLNMPRNRWEDALEVFDDIDVFCFDNEVQIDNPHIHYIFFNTKKKLDFFLFRAARHFNYRNSNILLCEICLLMIRVLNLSLINKILSTKYDYIHSSYNDFDESAFLTILLKPATYTRAQKETRLYYSYFEEKVFKDASRIVLNDPLNLDFFIKKYGEETFTKKAILYGLDEDVRTKRLLNSFQYSKKLSESDGKVHAVILAGRVLSDPNDSRSGGRLYYINLIQNLIDAGIVVHLHTANIVPYKGNNPYTKLELESESFRIEDKLDFLEDSENAYRILSQYDIGVCHAHLPNTEVTEFDKVNIPHRYYEYHLAHVAPFDLKGGNLLLEKKAVDNHALIVESYREITLASINGVVWDIPTFSDYIHALYPVGGHNG